MNQSKTPQFGHGASPGGWDGSTQIKASQTGQGLGTPSGVREEMKAGMARSLCYAANISIIGIRQPGAAGSASAASSRRLAEITA